jgi:hypothetical protein
LGNPDELPQDGRLNFFLKTQSPEVFPPTEKVEVATEDESFHVLLSEKDGNLTLQDAKTIFAVLDPMKLLGPSAFGPLKFRPVGGDGVEGDWQPLANLVRVPELKAVRCTTVRGGRRIPSKDIAEKAVPEDLSSTKVNSTGDEDAKTSGQGTKFEPEQKVASSKSNEASSEPDEASESGCTLTGDKLFLINAVSADPDFTSAVTVPDGFVEAALTIPAPKGKMLYLKLRDDPATIDTAIVPILTIQP